MRIGNDKDANGAMISATINRPPALLYLFGQLVNSEAMGFQPELVQSGWRNSLDNPNHWEVKLGENSVKVNSSGFRSDEFTKEHDGKHILFSGCSETWGDGNYIEDVWAYKVYEEISKNVKTSGFFNLGFPGTSIAHEIFYIFKYINTYGMPDAIFFFMPNATRFMTIDPNHGKGTAGIGSSMMGDGMSPDDFSQKFILYITYELYSMLHTLCEQTGTKLISSSWSVEDAGEKDPTKQLTGITDNLLAGFDSVFTLDMGEPREKFLFDYIQKFPDAKITAIDNIHSGDAEQAFYANMFLGKYNEDPWV
jgi:hypothetical protein